MPIGIYGRPVYYAPIPYAPMYAASAPPAPGGGSPPTGYSPRSVAEWQRYYAKPQQPYPYYGAYVSAPPWPPQHAHYAPAPLVLEEPPPPPSRKRNRYTTTYKQGQSAFRFKGTAANILATPADDTVQHFPDSRGRTTARSPPSKRDVSPVTSPRGTTRFRIKPGVYDNLIPSSPEAADDGSVELGDDAVPPALLERFRALDAAETRKRAESDVQSATSSPRTITSPGTTPPASPRARPIWSGVCDDDASWAEEPAPAENGFVHQGEIFFSPGKPVVVPTLRSSRGSKFDLPSPSTAIRVLKNDLF